MNFYFKSKFVTGCGLLLMTSILMSLPPMQYNQQKNSIELISALNSKSKNHLQHPAIKVFTPLAPYNGLTCIVSCPGRVKVGQTFTLTFTIKTDKASALLAWNDLMPADKDIIRYTGQSVSTMGTFVAEALGITRDLTQGSWIFNQGFQTNSIHSLSIELFALRSGTVTYSSSLATNPVVSMGPISIIIED
jgi:hypothetical protein